jgi:hypothetical protein
MHGESEPDTHRQFKKNKKQKTKKRDVNCKAKHAVRYKVYQRRRKGIVIQRYQVKFRSIGTVVPNQPSCSRRSIPPAKSPHSKEECDVVT